MGCWLDEGKRLAPGLGTCLSVMLSATCAGMPDAAVPGDGGVTAGPPKYMAICACIVSARFFSTWRHTSLTIVATGKVVGSPAVASAASGVAAGSTEGVGSSAVVSAASHLFEDGVRFLFAAGCWGACCCF